MFSRPGTPKILRNLPETFSVIETALNSDLHESETRNASNYLIIFEQNQAILQNGDDIELRST